MSCFSFFVTYEQRNHVQKAFISPALLSSAERVSAETRFDSVKGRVVQSYVKCDNQDSKVDSSSCPRCGAEATLHPSRLYLRAMA